MKQVIFNALQTSLSGGIGRYSYELSKAIYEQKLIDLKIVIREEDMALFDFASKDDLIIASRIENSRNRNYYEQFILPYLVYKDYPDAIIHYPDSMAPMFSKNKVVITVHDLAFKSLKNAFKWKSVCWKKFATDLSIKKATKIIAITNFAKSEIKKFYLNINQNKIKVIYNGFNDFSKEQINNNNINKNLLQLCEERYILTVSTISPRKNIDGLIKAFNLIKDKNDYVLVVAGKNGWLYEDIYELVDELDIKDRVVFTGGINDDELKFLYKNSILFIYPSFYEGFGLPPLEAMSYGIPVIASNVTSMPEVLSNEVTYIDPNSYQDIASKIQNIDLKKVQYNIVNKYKWDTCAIETIKLYETI